ncbi:glycosyltransferase family 2 protein [Vibrio sp. ZSDE26]|uniref:Glycosyltransferase family 2 protein n=1 Tax=Vibrio amylolyticus TaxID=2847292 RepID=A0A9X1XKX9_9VIBR|nr:glycosyltransferase family 2 protein [Vibrio amylolyticus]MCK6264075.1 glycosyltransferase family 2 protein [Vibrio amylolyticus]
MSKVSVIIPTYNCIQYLPKCLESVVTQSHRDLEIIVVDDNSNDGTADLLSDWMKKDPRIMVITTSGLGAANARNLAINAANGDYIAFLDSDDFWWPEKIEKQVEIHKRHPEIALSFTDFEYFNEAYQSIEGCFNYLNISHLFSQTGSVIDEPLELVLTNSVIGTSTVMIKSTVLKSLALFDSSLDYSEDLELWLRVCESHKIGVINSIEAGYLIRKSSMTQSIKRRWTNLACTKSVIEKYRRREFLVSRRVFNKAYARIFDGAADNHRDLNQYSRAVWSGMVSFCIDPQKRKIRGILGDCRKYLFMVLRFDAKEIRP